MPNAQPSALPSRALSPRLLARARAPRPRRAPLPSAALAGCFFYRVRHADGRESGYLVKQITAAEKSALLRILPAYREHVARRHGATLVHYYGCHSVRLRWVAR